MRVAIRLFLVLPVGLWNLALVEALGLQRDEALQRRHLRSALRGRRLRLSASGAERQEAFLLHAAERLRSAERVLEGLLAVNATSLRGGAALPSNVSDKLHTEQKNLQDLLSHLKENIGKFNKQEGEGKDKDERRVKQLQERLAQDSAKLQGGSANLSAFEREVLQNRTRMEEQELKFWTRGRELSHSMFHSNLKLTHGLMSGVKTVMEAYKQMLDHGKIDPELAEAMRKVARTMPKVQRSA
eukprot:TRINITY_DN18976_c0_g1_i1.p1 TRINITY_DN18976_c0_g1~~TRINITY_DN18976_c0_g1_i1.p1  ORF type:complete len:242 (-),score=73.92 TRINITY_DN18976_c0_g1_i1:101-826(-)